MDTANRWLLWGITPLLVTLWLVGSIVRQLPSPLPTRWVREAVNQLYLSCSIGALWRRPRTIVTYTPLHSNDLHLLLNLLPPQLFGEMQLRHSGWRQLVQSYPGGAVVGGIAFVLCASLSRAGEMILLGLPLVGASAPAIAFVGCTVGTAPRARMPLPLIGSLRIQQVRLFIFLLLLLAYGGCNVDGLTTRLTGVLRGCGLGLYYRRRQRSVRRQEKLQGVQTAYYQRLLDGVQQSGYQNLSDEERKQFVEYNNR